MHPVICTSSLRHITSRWYPVFLHIRIASLYVHRYKFSTWIKHAEVVFSTTQVSHTSRYAHPKSSRIGEWTHVSFRTGPWTPATRGTLSASFQHAGRFTWNRLGIVSAPEWIYRGLSGIQMIDIYIPTTDGRHIVMSRYTQPEKDVSLLLAQTLTSWKRGLDCRFLNNHRQRFTPPAKIGCSADLLVWPPVFTGLAAYAPLELRRSGERGNL